MDRPAGELTASLEAMGFRLAAAPAAAASGIGFGTTPEGPAFLRWASRRDRQAVLCLQREASALRALALRGVPRLLDGGVDADFVVSAQTAISAAPLSRALPKRPLLFAARLIRLIAEVHQQEWVHGDVKPSNVMIDACDRPFLVDWEFATRPGEVSLPGTLGWAPPDAWSGSGISSPASDVYSLAVVVWELLARRRAFVGTRDEILAQQETFFFSESNLGPLPCDIHHLFESARRRVGLRHTRRWARVDDRALAQALAFHAASDVIRAMERQPTDSYLESSSAACSISALAKAVATTLAIHYETPCIVSPPETLSDYAGGGNGAAYAPSETLAELRPLSAPTGSTTSSTDGGDSVSKDAHIRRVDQLHSTKVRLRAPAPIGTVTELRRALSACVGPVRASAYACVSGAVPPGDYTSRWLRAEWRQSRSDAIARQSGGGPLSNPKSSDDRTSVMFRGLVRATTEILEGVQIDERSLSALCDAWANFGRADAALVLAEHSAASVYAPSVMARKLRALATLRKTDELERTVHFALDQCVFAESSLEIARARAVISINHRDPAAAVRLLRRGELRAASTADPSLFALALNTLGNGLRLSGRRESALRAYRFSIQVSEAHSLRSTRIAAERNVLILQWELGRRAGLTERWISLAEYAARWGMHQDAVDAAARGAQHALVLGLEADALTLVSSALRYTAATQATAPCRELLERVTAWVEDRCESWSANRPPRFGTNSTIAEQLLDRELRAPGRGAVVSAPTPTTDGAHLVATTALTIARSDPSPHRLAVLAVRLARLCEDGSPLATLVVRQLLPDLRVSPARAEFLRLLRSRATDIDAGDCVLAAHVIALLWADGLDAAALQWLRAHVDARGTVRPWGIRHWEWTAARALLNLDTYDRVGVDREIDELATRAFWLTPYERARYVSRARRAVDSAPRIGTPGRAQAAPSGSRTPPGGLAVLLDECADRSLSLTRADRLVLIIDRGGGSGRVVVRDRNNERAGADIEVCHSMLALADATDGGVIVDDALCDPRLGERPSVKLYRPRSVIVVPIVVAGQRVGYLYAENRSRGRALTTNDRTTLADLALEYGSSIDTEFLREERVRLSTEVEKARQESSRGRGLEVLGRRSSEVLHEIRNILTVVSGEAEIQTARDALDAESAEAFRLILQAARDGADVIQRIQNSVKAPDLNDVETVDAYEACHEVLLLSRHRLRGNGSGPSIRVQLRGSDGALVRVAPAELREILTNLVGNAIDAMPSGGSLSVLAAKQGDVVQIIVADSGVGMTQDQVSRAFEPFYSTKGSKGTGLGLPIVEGIVTRYGGTIQVESHVGKGTTFFVTLPTAVTSILDDNADRPSVVHQEAML